MTKEIWTAEKRVTEDGKELLIFHVLTANGGRQERRYVSALPLMFMLGGYPSVIGILMAEHPLPWSFTKVGNNIYLPDSNL